MTLPEAAIIQIMNARHLLFMAKDNIESHQKIRQFAGVNLLHDAVEAILLAVDFHKGNGRAPYEFVALFDHVDKLLGEFKLPFRSQIVQLNKLRVSSKHYAITPDRNEARRLVTSMEEFVKVLTEEAFAANFDTVHLVDLVDDEAAREAISKAAIEFESGNYVECLIECRKVIYHMFESWYSIYEYKDKEPNSISGIFMAWSRAPYYTKNPEWIRENVRDPFDYIQLDHRQLDLDLVKAGVEPEAFWNVWRGAPAVFRINPLSSWLVKRDLKIENAATKEHASFIMEQAIDIALRVSNSRRRIRSIRGEGQYFVRLKPGEKMLYRKADKEGPSAALVPDGLERITVVESSPGLRGDGNYWKVSHTLDGGTLLGGEFLYGYLHEENIDWSPEDVEEAK